MLGLLCEMCRFVCTEQIEPRPVGLPVLERPSLPNEADLGVGHTLWYPMPAIPSGLDEQGSICLGRFGFLDAGNCVAGSPCRRDKSRVLAPTRRYLVDCYAPPSERAMYMLDVTTVAELWHYSKYSLALNKPITIIMPL